MKMPLRSVPVRLVLAVLVVLGLLQAVAHRDTVGTRAPVVDTTVLAGAEDVDDRDGVPSAIPDLRHGHHGGDSSHDKLGPPPRFDLQVRRVSTVPRPPREDARPGGPPSSPFEPPRTTLVG